MYYARRTYDRFRGSDPMIRAIVIVAALIAASILLPRFWPTLATGVDCTGLPHPLLTGSNQSLLAAQTDPTLLVLELVPERNVLNAGDTLVLYIRFINNSMAPFTLFMLPEEAVLRYTGQEIGLMFSLIGADGRVLGEPPSPAHPLTPVRQQYRASELRMLGPRQRCTVRLELPPVRLEGASLTGGQYRITAVYRNQFKGTYSSVQRLTPTPIFGDQGVWVGQVQSNDIVISIGIPTPTPRPQ